MIRTFHPLMQFLKNDHFDELQGGIWLEPRYVATPTSPLIPLSPEESSDFLDSSINELILDRAPPPHLLIESTGNICLII